ncbi:MAG: MMPL family transporter [Solirubrobacteraceae bacterium]|nr:MMPL family transporter [Solirubrobacteraceae bacterium]
MQGFFRAITGKRGRWVVVAVWLLAVIGFGAAQLPSKFEKVQNNESTSFLPGDAESTKALTDAEEIRGEESVTIVAVYRNPDGLTAANKARIASDRRELDSLGLARTGPFAPPVFSKNGQAALLTAEIAVNGEGETITGPVDEVRSKVSGTRDGMTVKVTGSAGFSADAIKVFEGINGTLLIAASALVFILLALIYRSPLFLWIPLFSVGMAEIASRSIGYLIAEAGFTINAQASSIMSVLVLGAGTDYALLLVARYREELRQREDKREAAAIAAYATAPAIFASAITVMLALMCLTLAEVNGTAGLGPLGALGVAVAMVSMLTLLPALLAITGRRAFWPFVPRVGAEGADVAHGRWRRWGEWIDRHPRRVWIGTTLILLVMCGGLITSFSTNLTQADAYRDKVESVVGQELLATSFPSGTNAPTEVIVPDKAKVPAVVAALKQDPDVADARPVAEGPPEVLVLAALKSDPYSTDAYDAVPQVRKTVKAAGGQDVLVGGTSAVEKDIRDASVRDTKLIIPLVLLVVFIVLILLLRSLLAPVILIATVVLSFAATMGLSYVVYDVAFGFPGSDPGLPLFAFVFLVALGIDYNIFLMARVREEAQRYGTEHGMLRGLAVTGGVITSAGIVLAGTFAVLGVLPLAFLTQIGFAVAVGVLIDTFIVRSTLVPALVLEIGRKIWWPSKLSHEGDPGGPAPEAEPELEQKAAG